MDRAGLLFNSSRVGQGELWSVPKIIADAVLLHSISLLTDE
jgi:hypothetical protein